MMQDPGYESRWKAKLAWYRANGILPSDEGKGERGTLIVTRDNEHGGISSQEINGIITTVLKI